MLESRRWLRFLGRARSSRTDLSANPYKELARIAPYAVTAQVKVMTKVNGKNVPADYAKLVEMLRKATFRGYLIFEYEEPEDPYVAIPLHLKKLRKLIG